jgi:uracil-DNA glycosylase
MKQFHISDSWEKVLSSEFSETYFKNLEFFLTQEIQEKIIYPEHKAIFSALNLCSFEQTKVVLIGQDPYHGKNQANGLAFSVCEDVKIPPSLKNIFKELNTDLGIKIPTSGNLESWAKQGVLLLNATLTVRENEPGSHQNKGWEIFTDKIIEILSQKKENLVFLLWGNYAQRKETLIDSSKHLILKSAHPSPLARGAFFGSKPFSKTNEYLKNNKIKQINWADIDSHL